MINNTERAPTITPRTPLMFRQKKLHPRARCHCASARPGVYWTIREICKAPVDPECVQGTCPLLTG